MATLYQDDNQIRFDIDTVFTNSQGLISITGKENDSSVGILSLSPLEAKVLSIQLQKQIDSYTEELESIIDV